MLIARAVAVLIAAASLHAQSPALTQQQVDALVPKLRKSALRNRSDSLNLVYTQQAESRIDSSGTGKKWEPIETSEAEVIAAGNERSFKTISIDGKPVDAPKSRKIDPDEPNLVSQAFYPTWIFGTLNQASFIWSRWDTINAQRIMVLAFKAPSPTDFVFHGRIFPVTFHGLAYFTESDQALMRLEVAIDYAPGDSASHGISGWKTDYAYLKIRDRELMLPARMSVEGWDRNERFLTDSTFSAYRAIKR